MTPAYIIDRFIERHNYTHLDIRAALVDMDGTLYDSMPHHADAWMRMTRENGLEARREEFFLYEGRTGASTINILFNRQFGHDATPEEIERLYHQKTVYFSEMPPVDVMPGAQELMRHLRSQGIECVIVTGSGQSSLLKRIDTDYPGVFSEQRITSRCVTHGKPHPEPYLMALKAAGAEPWQAVAFENAPLGVKSAADAGVFTVGVVTGPLDAAVLADAGAAVVYNSMEECTKCFPELLYYLNTRFKQA